MRNMFKAVVLVLALACIGAESRPSASDDALREGNGYLRNGEYVKAVESYSRAINLELERGKGAEKGKMHTYYTRRGDAYSGKGDISSAIEDYTSSMKYLSTPFTYYKRGKLYESIGESALAVKDYETACAKVPGNEEFKNALAAARSADDVTITLTSPRTVWRSDYNVQACVKNGGRGRKVDSVAVAVNGIPVSYDDGKGVHVRRDDGCDRTVNRMVTLTRVGVNRLDITAWAGGGKKGKSEAFDVEYRREEAPVAPVVNPAVPPAVKGRRVALVIGNANYKDAPLRNPVKDAKDVTAKLESLNFEVTTVTDADYKRFNDAVRDFANNAKRSKTAVALFFYTGHGVQYENVSYFLPVNIDDVGDLLGGAASLDRVMMALEDTKAEVKIVMLDACRSNVFTKGIDNGGFAEPNKKPEGTFIMYATASGSVALDNSPFARSFLEHAGNPNLPLYKLFQKMVTDVKRDTKGKQVPWNYGSIGGDDDFYFGRW
jgi:tetratricopeptide (TPR) repeat protein